MDTPKNYVSYIIHNATNRGVEAKEVEMRNQQFDINSMNLTHLHSESGAESAARAGERSVEGHRDIDHSNPIPTSSSTDSYLHVVVQKHRTKDQGVNATQFPTRKPTASSPIKPQQHYTECGNTGNAGMYVIPHPMLYYPTIPPWHHSRMTGLVDTATSARSSTSFKKFVRAVRSEKKPPMSMDCNTIPEEDVITEDKWNCFGKNDSIMDTNESPERIEVYYFERGCVDYLSTTDCSPVPATEKFVIRSGRVVERIFSELCSVPQLFVTIPIELLIQSQRLFLIAFRNIMVKSTQTCSDYILKPLLTLFFNALIQPPLIFVGNIASAIRNTLQPVFGIVDDLISPVSKVLSSFHLIQIEKQCDKCSVHNV